MPNLDFDGHNTLFATHGLHSYAAKCPPQLVKYGVQYYSKPGEVVLDPMAGSGTTLVQSRLMGRHAIGFDIDPLARLIARVKATPIDDDEISAAYSEVKSNAEQDVRLLHSIITPSAVRHRARPPNFPKRNYWFMSSVSETLALLSFHIDATVMSKTCRDFLWVAFSSLILARTSVANAQDIIHSRHHYFEHPEPPDVLSKFDKRLKTMRRQMKEFRDICERYPAVHTSVRTGDARRLALGDETVDLIFSSPPYASALDYPRSHFLAVAWMQAALGINLETYRAKAPSYIGSELGAVQVETLPGFENLAKTQQVIKRLKRLSLRHASLTHRYFSDMHKTLSEMHRVLRPGRHAIIVICPSHIRKTPVPTHKVFAEMGNELGLKLKQEYRRTINARLRLMPYAQESFGKRMSTEYVLIFQKKR
jgi:hypothetical protein